MQGLADKAEASRIGDLHQLVTTGFRLLNERLSQARVQAAPITPINGDQEFKPRSSTEIMTDHARAEP